MTFNEIKLIFKGYQAQIKIETRKIYLQSLLTAGFISSLLSEDSKVPSYEDLFESNTEEYKARQIQNLANQFKNFAVNANEQRRQLDGRRET